jgi:hypothetical protein
MAPKRTTISAPKYVFISISCEPKPEPAEKSAFDVDASGAVLYKSHPSTATDTDAADDSVSEN